MSSVFRATLYGSPVLAIRRRVAIFWALLFVMVFFPGKSAAAVNVPT